MPNIDLRKDFLSPIIINFTLAHHHITVTTVEFQHPLSWHMPSKLVQIKRLDNAAAEQTCGKESSNHRDDIDDLPFTNLLHKIGRKVEQAMEMTTATEGYASSPQDS
jgi:hypothetical protein